MTYKIYTKDNYLYVEDASGNINEGVAKDVVIRRSNTSQTSFRISGLRNRAPYSFDITDLTDENGTAFTSASFIDFYTKNTGENAKSSVTVEYSDGANIDAFDRLRISDPANRFDGEFNYDTLEEIIDEVLAGSGSATQNADTRGVLLATGGATTGDYAGLHSYPIPYTPGCSQLVELTGVLDFAAIGSGTAQVFLRTKVSGSVVETVVDQADWDYPNNDLDFTYSQIFAMDFQSLKVGRIRYGFVRGGRPTYAHQIKNDNVRNTGYWQNPNLPVYWRIYNDATYTYMEVGYGNTSNAIGFRYRIAVNASATMTAICGTVKSEGADKLFDMSGYPQSANSAITPKTVSTTLIPLISIRPKSTFKSIENLAIAIPQSLSLQTDNPIRLAVYHDATLTGASWADVDTTHSVMEYDITATAFSGGHRIFSEYVATSKNIQASGNAILGKAVLWNRKSTNSGILTVVAIRTSGTDASVLTSLNWAEIR